MPFALLLALAATASGTLASYLYDRDAPFAARLCAGACTGMAALGLAGFLFASFMGLTPAALVLSAIVVASPLALLLKPEWRAQVRRDIDEMRRDLRRAILLRGGATGVLVFYLSVAILFWFLFGRAMFERGGEIYTGVDNNLGDLPFHISIITSFAFGDNFPPAHPEFAGVRLTYPFMVDFVTAMFVRAGASLRGALFWQNFVLALSFVGLLHRWSWKLTRDATAALIAPVLVLLSGGFGWLRFINEWRAGNVEFFTLLNHLPRDYTIGGSDALFKWGNALTTLLIPQRGLLLGLPLAIIVWTLWWQATEDEAERGSEEREKDAKGKGERAKAHRREEISAGASTPRQGKQKKRSRRRDDAAEGGAKSASAQVVSAGATASYAASADVAHAQGASRHSSLSPFPLLPFSALRPMTAAGIVAGLLPLVHAHSFVVMMGMGACLALLFPKERRAWAAFFGMALVLAVPQMFWATYGSAVRAGTFFGWEFGWDHGRHNVAWFWLMNTGLFIPLLVAALAWRGRGAPVVGERLLFFYLPFALCFIVPNFYKLSPFLWDNIKIIFYWWIASAPLVALLLVRLWRERALVWRAAAVAALVALTLAGSLDVWRVVSSATEQRVFDGAGVALAGLIKEETPPRSLILHAPTYNHPVFLTGRRSLMGYAGHLWTHGLDYAPRESDVRRMYAGGAQAEALLSRYGVDYVVVSPLERAAIPVNEIFYDERYTKVGEAGAYRLYKTTRR